MGQASSACVVWGVWGFMIFAITCLCVCLCVCVRLNVTRVCSKPVCKNDVLCFLCGDSHPAVSEKNWGRRMRSRRDLAFGADIFVR